METVAFVLLLFLPGSLAGPVSWRNRGYGTTECATRCTGTSKFQYDVGKTYQYEYEVSTTTTLNAHDKESAAHTAIQAIASINVLSKCELALQLSNVVFKTSNPDSNRYQTVEDVEYKAVLERNVLRFSFQDGRVEDLCPSDDETVTSLNLKRGILSSFQNSMNQHDKDESVQEIDVTGSCPTTYSMTQKDYRKKHINKAKDLLACSDRHNYKTFIQSSAFNMPNTIKSLPLLKGDHECQQEIKEGFVHHSACIETLVFRPFSKGDAGAATKTKQKLNHLKTLDRMSVRKGHVSRSTSLVFEHESKISGGEESLWATSQKLSELCSVTMDTIPATAPGLFTDMVYLMRGLVSDNLMDIYDRLNRGNICGDNKEKGRKFFMDAIPMIGTSASVEVIVELLLDEKVSGSLAEEWILSLNFINEPTIEMIALGKRLLMSNSVRKSSLLPVTSLINKFCRSHSCDSYQEYHDVAGVLRDILGNNCDSSEEDLVLLTLRAVRNIGTSQELVPLLTGCMESSDNSMFTRVFAAEAFRSVSCDADRRPLMDTFMNKGEDSELRIAAYLSLMQCPNEVTLSEVRKALEKETVNQVGSFVWTHLTNLLQTSSPQKQDIREILEDEKLKTEYSMDRRKFSRNYEVSFFSEKFGAGAMAESNVIFSSSSFIPRSVMLNLTVDMFGKSVNLLEVGGRIQGMELLLQKYLSSGGIFGKEDTGKKAPTSRCVKQQKMDRMKEKLAASKDEMSAAFYVKMFGTELGFEHLNEKDLTNLKDKFSINSILSSLAKGDDVSFTRSSLFLDSSLTVPTVGGMALRLSVNGSATVELIANGKIDMRRLSRKRMEANFNFKPSAAVKLSGLMSLDAGVVKSGVRMTTTLHTSTATTGSLDLTNGQLLNVDFDTPLDKMEVLDIKSEFFTVHNNAEKKQEMSKNKEISKKSCTSKGMLQVTGYELCGEVSFKKPEDPEKSPYFPFIGPVTLKLSIDKKDAPRGFKFLGKAIQNTDTSTALFSLDTPGSDEDRNLLFSYYVDRKAKSVEAQFGSPWKKVHVKGSYTSTKKSHSLSATLVNDGNEYKLAGKADMSTAGGMTIWTPTLELSRPEDSRLLAATPVKLSMEGSVMWDKKYKNVSAELNIKSGRNPDPINIITKFINKEKHRSLFGSVALGPKDIYSGTVKLMTILSGKKQITGIKLVPTVLLSTPNNKRLFLLSGETDYRKDKLIKGKIQVNMERTLKQPLVVDFKINQIDKKKELRYKGYGKLNSPFATVRARGSVNTIKAGTKLKKGPILTGKVNVDYTIKAIKKKALRRNVVIFSSKIHDRSTKALKKYDLNLNMESKKYQDASFSANGELSYKTGYSKAMVTIKQGSKAQQLKDKSKEISIGTTVHYDIKPDEAEVKYDVQIIYPKKKIEYQIEGKHEHKLKKLFKLETYTNIIYAKGKNIEFRLLGSNDGRKTDLDAIGSIELSFPGFELNKKETKGKSYKIVTTLKETDKAEYLHTINLQIDNKDKHSLLTKFKNMNDGYFEFYHQITVGGELPAEITFELNRDDKLLKWAIGATYGSIKLGLETTSEKLGELYYLNKWDFHLPTRRVIGSLEGVKRSDKDYILIFSQSWDADKHPSKKIELQMAYSGGLQEDGYKGDLNVLFTTPWEGSKIFQFRDYSEFREFSEKGDSFIKQEVKIIWASEDNELSYSYWLRLPVSPERFEVNFMVVTPLEILRKFNIEITHKLDPGKQLSTKVKSIYNKDDVTIIVLASNTGSNDKLKVDGALTLESSSLAQIRNVAITFKHNDEGKKITSQAGYTRNGEQYALLLNSQHEKLSQSMWRIESDLEINIPEERPIMITFRVLPETLRNNEHLMNLSLSMDWNPEYDFGVKLGYKYNKDMTKTSRDFVLRLPPVLRFLRKFDVADTFKTLEYHDNNEFVNNVYKGSSLTLIDGLPRKTHMSKYFFSKDKAEFEYSRGDSQVKFAVKLSYDKFPYVVHVQTIYPTYPNNVKIILDASIDENTYDGWSTNAKLITSFEKARNVNIKGDVKKISAADWNLEGEIDLGVKERITLSSSIDAEHLQRINVKITTPYKEMTNFVFGHTHDIKKGEYSEETHLEILPIFNKVEMKHNVQYKLKPVDISVKTSLSMPDTEFKVIQVNFNHQQKRRGGNTNVKVNYQPNKVIDLKFNSKYNIKKFPENTKVSLVLKTPFEDLPSLILKADVGKEQKKLIGNFDLKAKELKKYLKLKMEQERSDTLYNTDVTIDSSVFETVTGAIHLDIGELAGLNVTLDAPSIGRSVLGFKKKSNSWTDFQNKVFMEINGYDLDMDIGLKHLDKETKAWLTYAYPGAEHSYIKTLVHRNGDTPLDFDVGGFLKLGRSSKPYNVSMQFSYIKSKYALGTTFKSPYSKDLSYLFSGESLANGGHETKVYAVYGKRFLLDTMTSVKLQDASALYKTSTTYKLDESSHKSGATIKAEWSKAGEDVYIESHADESWVKAELEHKKADANNGDESVDLQVFTPFDSYKDIGVSAVVTVKPSEYNGKCTLEYKDGEEAVLVFDLSKPSKNKVEVKADLALPIQGYNKNTIVYNQISNRNKFSATAEVLTGRNEAVKGKIELNNNEDLELTLTGPLKEFESLKISGKVDEGELRFEGKMNLKLSLNSRPITADVLTHINNEPLLLQVKLKSPYDDIKKVDFDLKHWGREWKQWKTNAALKSNKIGSVRSETNWRFDSLSDMEGSTALFSKIENVRNAKLAFNTKGTKEDKVSHVEVQWDNDKKIASDLEWTFTESQWRHEAKCKAGLTTTFDPVKQVDVVLAHSYGEKKFSDSLKIDLNEETQFDGDLSYDFERRHQGTIEIRKPRPLAVEFSGTADSSSFDGRGKLVWDKKNPEAHIEVESMYADLSDSSSIDKSFKFKVFNPARIVGTSFSYKQSENELLSAGSITSDEQKGKTFSYDIGWNNRSSRYTKMFGGHVKLGVPQRGVKVQGSYSGSETSQTLSSAVHWDVDKDDTKKVTMSTSVEAQGTTKRVGFNVNLPSINKQLNLGVSSKGSYGGNLMDTKTELSYSSDPRKTITVTSKIDNEEFLSDKFYNYTVQFGVMHPVTGLNIQMASHIGSKDSICSAGSRLSFDSARKETKTLEWRAQMDKANQQVDIQFSTPLKDVRMEGKLENKREQQHIIWRSFEDGKQAYRLDIDSDPRRRKIEMEFNYEKENPDKMVQMIGQMVNDSAVRLDVTSYEGRGKQRPESMMAVRLNSSNILHTRITWRPPLLNELQTYLSTKVTVLSYASNQVFDETVKSIGAEIKTKYVLMSKELNTELQQVFRLMDQEMDTLNDQLQSLKTEIRRSYQRNDLNIKNIGKQVEATFKELVDQMNEIVLNYRRYYLTVTQATEGWLSDITSYPVAQKYGAVINSLVENLKALRGAVENVLDQVVIGLEKFSKVSYRKYIAIKRDLDRKLNSYEKTMKSLKDYKKLIEQATDPDLVKLGIVKGIDPSLIPSQVYLQIQLILRDQFHDMMERPEFQRAHALAHEIHDQFQSWNANKTLANTVRRVVELTKTLALMQLNELKDTLLNFDKTKVIVFDPRKGELQLEIHLPFTLKSLVDPPKFKVGKYLKKLNFWNELGLPTSEANLLKMYDYVPSLTPSDWVPPFDGSAYLIGSQHFLTFDGHHYDFLSQCSHVLARDMLEDKFSVVVNYDKKPRHNGVKSLCFNLENTVNFEITKDYKLSVNNMNIEMPYISDKVQILREGDTVRVEYVGGVVTLLNPKLDIYKVSVTGWYHGRLAGMMGVYDNERGNDMMTPHSWNDFEVNRKSCNSRNVAVSPAIDNTGLCHKYLGDTSSKYRMCFHKVASSHFVQLCQTYMTTMTPEEAIHKSTEQYRFVCAQHGIYMGPLREYSSCGSKSEFTVDGRDPIYQSADVVFVVEDTECNKWAANSLATMATKINKALENAGMKDNRFGLEGYGNGVSGAPTARTINGHILEKASNFPRAVETMSFEKSSHEGNVHDAILMAMKYPYRPGVAKVLVLAPCSSCEVGLLERYLDSYLKNNAFTVHILQEQGFSLNNKVDNNYKIYGMDNSKTFTNHISDSGLTPVAVQRIKEVDYCSRLAKTTLGSVFDVTHLHSQSSIKDEFITSFAHRVGMDTKLPQCQMCQCNTETGDVDCTLCGRGHILTNSPLEVLNIPRVIGHLNDVSHNVKNYFLGLQK